LFQLTEWSSSSNLGKIVKDIGKEFKNKPPTFQSGEPRRENPSNSYPLSSSSSIHASEASSSFSTQSVHSSSSPQQSPSPSHPPSASSSLNHISVRSSSSYQTRPRDIPPEVEALSSEELEQLLENEEKFERFLAQVSQGKNVDTVLQQLEGENERIALCALEKEPMMLQLQESYASTQQMLRAQEEELKTNAALLEEKLKVFIPLLHPCIFLSLPPTLMALFSLNLN